MAWEMDKAQTWGLWVAQTFFWQMLHAISFIYGCPLPSCSIIFHSPIPFSGFSVSLVFCLWKERCRDWTLQPEIPASLSSISAGLSQTLQFRVSMTHSTVPHSTVHRCSSGNSVWSSLPCHLHLCIAKGTERKGKVFIFWEAEQWLLFRGQRPFSYCV